MLSYKDAGATEEDWGCCHGRAPLLSEKSGGATPVLLKKSGSAIIEGCRCYRRRPGVLPWEDAGDAEEDRRCYHARTSVLLKKNGCATLAGRKRYDDVFSGGGIYSGGGIFSGDVT